MQNLVQVLIEGLKEHLSPHGVDAVEYTVLRVCGAMGTTSIRDLREIVPIDPPHMSRTTNRLEDMGLLKKVRLRDDRRLVSLTMTEAGASLMPELAECVNGYYALLVTDISIQELGSCIAVMERMISATEKRENPAAADSPKPSSDEAGVVGDTQSQSIESHIGTLQNNVTRLVNVMYQGIHDRVSPFGLAVGEYSILAACSSTESITISGIAQRVPLDAARISRITSRLEDMEMIRKVRPGRDRRVVRVEVTDEGRALVLDIMPSVTEHYANVASRVSDQELTDLIAFIERMTANAEVAKWKSGDGPGPA